MPSNFDVLSVLLVIAACLAYANSRFLKLPLNVGLLAGGFGGCLLLIGLNRLLPGLSIKSGIRHLLAAIDFPATLLSVFLAFLLFAGALQVNSTEMLQRKWTILALATLGTVLSTGLAAAALLGLSSLLGLGIDFPWCLVFGALISPTDPVSVLDVLRRVGIPRPLQATVAGESLFNDGIGVVLFTLALALAIGGPTADPGAWHIAGRFLLQAGGGGLLGFLLGTLAARFLRQTTDHDLLLIISLALATGTYSLAGRLGVSGPVAVVVAGILVGHPDTGLAKDDFARSRVVPVWRLIEEVLNALLFLLIGLEVAAIDLAWRNLAAMAAMIPIVLVIRFCSVAASAVPLHVRLAQKSGPLLILTWGGLRGGLSLAMALALPDGAAKGPILTMAYGIVVFSIVVQGLTLAPLARRAMAGATDR